MTDRELLEAAAKAAGLTLGAWSDNYGAFMYRGVEPGKSWWNALTDDGDALRLAVKLEMELKVYNTSAHAASAKCERSVCASEKGDPLAATRRAIVRAAAEIGNGMAPKAPTDDLPEDNYYKTQAEAEELGRSMK
jgi:hypothetical protein